MGDLVGRFKEDHRHADSFGWHRSWQNDLSLVALGDGGKVLLKKKLHSEAADRLHCEHADLPDRDGGMLWLALPGSCFTGTRATM
jgi:hypothetical protein